jgi:pyruvate dehydrogenase E2 component (dihydrolipoamide acetyltransferase)
MATTVTMPQLGETITEGTILSWAKKPGEAIAEDEVLLEISTDKVDTEVPSPVAGIVLDILVPEGETVSVGTPLVVIGEDGEDAGDITAPVAAAAESTVATAPAAESAPEPAPAPEPVPVAAAPELAPGGDDAPKRSVLSPVVRKLAAENNIDLNLVPGTGDGGRITRKDVSRYMDAQTAGATPPPPPAAPTAEVTFEPAPAPAPTPAATPAPAPASAPAAAAATSEPTPSAEEPVVVGPDRVEQMPRLRKVIAENMLNAKRTAAHVWTSVEVDYERIERVRQQHKAGWKSREGYSLTYMPFIARATIDALGAFPVVNSSFDLEHGTQTFHSGVRLGIAVDLNEGGLVVMNMPGADGLSLTGLARGIRGVADKARGGKLELDDLSGSTFTITNPGPFGSFMSAPIINIPNVAILSTDTVTKRPTVVTQADGSDAIAIRHIGYLGLTWDHRVFDGSTAVLFLRRIKENLETWDWDQELA